MSNRHDEDDKDQEILNMFDSVDKDGVVCRSVTDGHVLVFKRATLQKVLDDNKDSDKIIIFIKRQDLN